MAKKCLHILLFAVALIIPGCGIDLGPSLGGGTGMVLTVRCDNPLLTKADPIEKDGEQRFNENLITSVDFLFYPGENPAADAPAIHHIRETLNEDPMGPGHWEASFTLVLKQDIVDLIFTAGDASSPNHNKATVYALVNFEEGEVFSSLSETSHAALAAKIITTDFAQTETDFIQPCFKMDGQAVVTYDGSAIPSVDGEIRVKRFASKLSVAVHVEDRVTLHHRAPEQGDTEPDEVWTPVLHTMRLYLVDGVKTVQLSHDGTTLPDPASEDVETASHKPGFFSYKDDAHRRPFLREDDTEYLPSETITLGTAPDEVTRKYYNTWPMYSYPRHWSDARQDYGQTDYSQGLPTEQPYLKLEMDWRREADAHYSYDRRKYYYKIYMPFNDFTRNRWYAFYLDIGILGSETDEGKAFLDPTYCYLLDWQNKSSVIDRHAEITKARYLSVEKQNWQIHNVTTLSVPFISSHIVDIVPGSVKATRPYYGDITDSDHPVGSYHSEMHAWIRLNDGANYINTYPRGSYYLDYVQKPGDTERPAADAAYNPVNWLDNTSTSIVLNHNLQNDYQLDGFDYSPYTITFDIVHSDLLDDPTTYTYSQYIRHITIVQYPGIHIEATRNHDTGIKVSNSIPYYEPQSDRPWTNYPWGYVYVNGQDRHFLRQYKRAADGEPFFKLQTDNAKREYQWQTMWYTGGSRDIFNINVTVLPANSVFIIGDPRTDEVDNLDDSAKYPGLYEFSTDNTNDQGILGYASRTGFNEEAALYGPTPRKLQHYYPTDKSSRTTNMLAPSYRIASKFGGTEYGGNEFADITKEYAEYRCAAYQEDGFPAGRWRLPTKSEIHFIAQLSAKKAFEFLFGNTVYWSAHGAIRVNANGTVSNDSAQKALLRCVYDSWYWDEVDEKNKGVANFNDLQGDDPRHTPDRFIWGDKER